MCCVQLCKSELCQGKRKKNKYEQYIIFVPKNKNERRVWCNLIKRKDGMDGFQVTENSTYVCSIHFKPGSVIRAPGGTRHSLQKGARPYLHQWNNFGQEFKERSHQFKDAPPTRKKLCLDPCDFQIDDSQLIDFDSVDKDQQEAELLRLRNEIELLKEKTEKQNNFFKHILSTDKTCKHYTGFPNIAMLEAVYNFMDPGEDGENIVLSNSKNAKENEARGRKRLLCPILWNHLS